MKTKYEIYFQPAAATPPIFQLYRCKLGDSVELEMCNT
jgi:hypothetical protein